MLLAGLCVKLGDRQVAVPILGNADGGPEMMDEQNINTSVVSTLSPGRVPENGLPIQLGQAAVFQFPIGPLFPGPLLPPAQLEVWPWAVVPLLRLARQLGVWLCVPAPDPVRWGHGCKPGQPSWLSKACVVQGKVGISGLLGLSWALSSLGKWLTPQPF